MRKGLFVELPQRRQPLASVALCGVCRLYQDCSSPFMPVWGDGKRKVMVIGEAPGAEEDISGKPFVGKAGQLLRTTLDKLGVDLDRDCWVTNSVICRPPNNQLPDKAVDFCRPNVVKAIKDFQPEVIVLLGAAPVKSVLGWLWKEDPKGISRWAGFTIPCQSLNTWICPTWHPSYLLREEHPVLDLQFQDHLRKAFSKKGRPWKVVPKWEESVEIILDDVKAGEVVKEYNSVSSPVAWDLECNMLKPDSPDARIYSCSLSDGKRTISFPWLGKVVDAMREFLKSPTPKVGWNCFSGDTKFLTREDGLVCFRDKVGEKVTVLNGEGRWVEAVVKKFGKQKTVETTFGRRNFLVTVRSTYNHRWLSSEDGKIIETVRLRKKRYGPQGVCFGPDRVPYLCSPKVVTNEDEYMAGVRHGIVLGDGEGGRDKKKTYFQVRLCSEKGQLLKFFDGFPRSYPPSYGGEPIVYLSRQLIHLKKPPPSTASESYLVGFARGLLATDGTVQWNGQVCLTNSKEVVDWCYKHLPRVGFLFQSKFSLAKYANKYANSLVSHGKSWTITFSRESVQEDDLLRKEHKSNFKFVELGPFKFYGLGEEREEEVFCAVVPDGESFTLADGLVTGNCKYDNRWAMKEFGFLPRNTAQDGMLNAHAIDNRKDSKGLKFQSFAMLGYDSYSDYVEPFLKGAGGGNTKNRIHEADLKKILLYGGLDSLLTYKIIQKQVKLLGTTL